MLNLIGSTVDQSGEFLKNISINEISQTFSYLIQQWLNSVNSESLKNPWNTKRNKTSDL
jgi:hypothetical protein